MINIENVSKFILSDISLSIPKGCVVGLIGATGSGKTTLVKLVSRLLLPEAGRVSVMGKNPVTNRGRYGSKLSVFFTGVPLLESEDNALIGMDMIRNFYSIPRDNFTKDYTELSKIFGFEKYENEKLKNLSAGQRSRVELAAAFILNADLMILDEPDVGLDEEGKMIFEELVKERAKRETTFLITSHNLTEISNLCDRIAILSDGELAFYGSERVLRSQHLPINTMTVVFDGTLPNIDDLPIVRYKIEGNTAAYDYNSKYITAAELINVLMKQTRILDVKIKKPDLEEIIINMK